MYRFGKLYLANIRPLVMAVLLSAATAVPHTQRPNGEQGPSGICKGNAEGLPRFQFRRGDVKQATRAIQISNTVKPGDLKVSDVLLVGGPCVSLIRGYSTGQIALQDGRVFDVSGDGSIRSRDAQYSLFAQASSPRLLPKLSGARLIEASKVAGNSESSGATYLGLWQSADISTIAVFNTKNKLASPRLLVTSKHHIVGIKFFPSPDSASGTVGIVLRGDPFVSLVTLNWHHGKEIFGSHLDRQ